jgi:glycosyltransferase involved in cell wall biosynthesis
MTAVAAPLSPLPLHDLPRRDTASTAPMHRPTINALQIGVSWFAEKPGGLDRYFCELLNHLPEVDVIGRGYVMGSERVQRESQGTVVAAAESDASMWARWSAIRRHVGAEMATGGVSLVAAHHSLYTCPVLSLIKGVPLVVHFHGPFAAESSAENSKFVQNSVKHMMERAVYSRAVRCITLSKAFATILHESYGVPTNKIRIVPGAVETARFDPPETKVQARQRLGWPTDRPIAFSVRRLYRRMGLENLIDAVQTVRQRVPDTLVMIAGTGWMADELRRQIKAAKLQEHVKLMGFIPDADLPVAYRAADLTVVPSVSLEGFGLTTVESMAAGTPVIVTPVGGSPEVVGGLSPDMIVPDWTPAALAAAISAALRGELKLPNSDRCKEFARQNFDWAAVTQKVRAVYDEALAVAHPEAA